MSVAAPAGTISPCHDVFLNVCVRICSKRQKEREREKKETYSLSKDGVQSTGYVIVVVID